VLGRRKQPPAEAPTSTAAPTAGSGKNRPTPKRREAEAARKQPLVPGGRAAGGSARAGGKAGAKATREAARIERMHARQQMLEGNERYLPARDRGPVRRYVRDAVDARRNVGELLLPVMVVVLLLSFVGNAMRAQNPGVYTAIFALTYVMFLLSAVDSFLLARRLKKQVTAKFGADAWVRGTSWYAVMRAFQIRRTRVPKPQVARGQHPA
jgi:hypothetical protein